MTKVNYCHINQHHLRFWMLLFITTLLFLSVISGCTSTDSSSLLSVHLIDVGQGDSQLIITPQQNVILIDAGDSLQGDRIAAYLTRHGVNQIDHFILTHPHSDHIGGGLTILEQFQVSNVYLPPVVHTSQLYERILVYLSTHDIPTTIIRETSPILEEDQLEVRILATGQDFDRYLNNWSLITHVSYGTQGFLFMGDAEADAEEALITSFYPDQLKASVIKAGHHGSATSTSEPFLDVVQPDIVLISCGEDNPYFHPHPELIKRLEDHEVWVYRTDLQGSVILHSDGTRVFSHQQPVNH